MGICSDNEARRRGEGAFSKKVGSKLRFDRGEKEVPTEGEPSKTQAAGLTTIGAGDYRLLPK
jgi:hypothetical protein